MVARRHLFSLAYAFEVIGEIVDGTCEFDLALKEDPHNAHMMLDR